MTDRHDGAELGGAASSIAVTALSLARGFAAGGTLWCWAPGAPEHAQHLAVEFVHPLVVGARALPAVAVVDDDATTALRPMARAGDALIAVTGGEQPITGALRRAEAWGLTTIHLGVGRRPLERTAEHVIWLSDAPAARHDGRLVLGYHVLWELTHVCFEHPGLLATLDDTQEECTVCSDEGHLGEVIGCEDDDATIRTAAGIETVNTMLVGPVHPGDLVLVHAGTALSLVDA